MNTTIELVLADGTRELAGTEPYDDRDHLESILRDRLGAVRSRPDVVAVAAWHEGGQVRVDRLRAPGSALKNPPKPAVIGFCRNLDASQETP